MTLKRKANAVFYYKVIKRLEEDMQKYISVHPDWDTLHVREGPCAIFGHKTYLLSLGVFYENIPIKNITFSETFKTKDNYWGKQELRQSLEFMFNQFVMEID